MASINQIIRLIFFVIDSSMGAWTFQISTRNKILHLAEKKISKNSNIKVTYGEQKRQRKDKHVTINDKTQLEYSQLMVGGTT